MEETPQLPEIAVSRTSSSESNKKKSQSKDKSQNLQPRQEIPFVPQVRTDHSFQPYWKYGKIHASSWKQLHDTRPEWHIKWDRDCFQNGRVLMIDYKSNEEFSSSGKRHIAVASQEFQELSELRRFYADSKRVRGAALRVIHVQNASWATSFFMKKFNIDHPSELIGMQSFSKWAMCEKPRQRNGKPFPRGRSWRGQTDPWRNVARTAFGMDYLKTYATGAPSKRRQQRIYDTKPAGTKAVHLNAYEDSNNPYGYDIAVQRMSIYVQRSLGPLEQVSPELRVKSPYAKGPPNRKDSRDPKESGDKVLLGDLDNSNTIIILETSASGLLEDCLVQPRNDLESRWRRLSFYLRKDDVLSDARLSAQCTDFILSDLFHQLTTVWDQFLAAASDHVTILEDKIYENPADESRAPELWTNQAAWLKVEKVLWIHSDMVKEIQGHMRDLAGADDEMNSVEVDWLASTPAEYERLAHALSEDLIQPTNNLNDLMYKSVGIRDSRQSLQLGLSMWRLSWITFIFLPLTFIVGFFGMNVNTFADNPDIGWYFVAAVVLMIFVLLLWYCVKHSLQRSRQTPYQRGLYESLFSSLEDEYPNLWTSTGAAADVNPDSFINRFKWRLIKSWFSPEKTINKRLYSSIAPGEQASDLGTWARTKRYLLLRWLGEIQRSQEPADPIELVETGGYAGSADHYETSVVGELAKYSTPIAVADAEPVAADPLSTYGLHVLPHERQASRSSEDRPSSRGSSGIMIEERNLSDSESDAGVIASEAKRSAGRSASR